MASPKANLNTSIEINELGGERKDNTDYNNMNNNNGLMGPPPAPQNIDTANASSPKRNDQPMEFETVLTKLVTRNWEIILFFVLLSAYAGFIVYLFSGTTDWIWALAIVGLVIGLVIDEIYFGSKNVTEYQAEKSPEARYDEALHWKPYEFAKVICKTELEHPRMKHINYKNWVLSDDKTMIFHYEALARIIGYKGWEIGASILSFIGFLWSVIVRFTVYDDNTIKAICGNIGIVLLVTIIAGIVGAIIEKILRHYNLLFPTDRSVEKEIAVPLHELGHFEYIKLGYSHVFRQSYDVMLIERLALLWFKFLILVAKIIIFCIQLIYYFFYINAFFSLLLILTLDLYFLYRAHIEKDPVYLKGGLIVSWILVIVTIMIVWFFSSHINRGRSQFDVGMYHVAKMDESRMEQVKIRRFFWNLCLVIITMIVVSSMISYLFDAFFNVKFPVISIGKKNPWFRDLTCASIEGASGNTPGSITVDDDTNWCADKNYYIMALVLIIVTVLWFWLLISSLLFYLADKRSKVFTLFDKDKDNRKWIQYTGFWIYRNPYIKYPQSSYHSNNGFINFFMTPIYQLFWTNGVNRSTFPIYIELSPSDATLLSQYLMTHLSLYRSSDNEMSNQSNYNANSGGSSMNLNSNRR